MMTILFLALGLVLLGGGLATLMPLRCAFAQTPPAAWASGEQWREMLLLIHFTATLAGLCFLLVVVIG
ncbi:MAG: hypothetical protein KJ904_06245 [Alphaproteobacteria bacterium]|nr:hypothetical protein [Alphaproteobacteria bacterium]MBU0796395.1 hypothetical protein [Alphaproteobacteria bacterium]MBU0886746.1 hypothetical protein [Alphaproteobacteria bacterium]MBU1812641.1 hypothetical protein [Alphaproteobacteria bacterium]